MKVLSLFICFLLFTTCIVFAQTPTERYALVIGVQNYMAIKQLQHSLNDANDMALVLKSKGFKVDLLRDPKTNTEIKDAIRRYFKTITKGTVGVIYYSGHATVYDGVNYLIPANAKLEIPADLDDQCVKMDFVMNSLNTYDNLNILILDACRTNDIKGFTKGITDGLVSVEPPKGSIVLFAAQPGKTASDGTGRNGLFTSKLLKYINEPDLDISGVLKKVKQEVHDESKGGQLPSYVDNSLGGDFYFNPTISTAVQPTKNQIIAKQETADVTPVTTTAAFDYGYGPDDAPTIIVGKQEWMVKNLNIDRFANGDPIPQASTAEEWKRAGKNKEPAWCYYNNDPSNGSKYGKLYNWYAVSDPRGLAPKGWHVPTDAEWNKIIEDFGGQKIAGASLKSTSGWSDGGMKGGNGDNKSGIGGLPGGSRSASQKFGLVGGFSFWWSSSEPSSATSLPLMSYDGLALGCVLTYINSNAVMNPTSKSDGLSVRCVRD